MRAAVFHGAGDIRVEEVPQPVPGPGEALIRVGYCGICGSDVEAYATGMYEPGLILGHEFAGSVAAVGPGVAGWRVGDRVVVADAIPCSECACCRDGRPDSCESLTLIGVTHDGALAGMTCITARGLVRLPAGLSLRLAALAEPLSVVLRAVRRSRLRVGDNVLIMGAGPIGLLALQCARLAGARRVIVTEVDPARTHLAVCLGATAVLDPRRDNVSVALAGLTDGRGPDVVFVCTGAPGPFADAISLVRKGGQIYLLGVCVEPVEADFMSIVMGDLSLEGSLAGHSEMAAAVDFIAQRRVDVESLISHEIALDDVVALGFDRLSAPGSGAVKILVRIGGEA